jgi:hypothetical protein
VDKYAEAEAEIMPSRQASETVYLLTEFRILYHEGFRRMPGLMRADRAES